MTTDPHAHGAISISPLSFHLFQVHRPHAKTFASLNRFLTAPIVVMGSATPMKTPIIVSLTVPALTTPIVSATTTPRAGMTPMGQPTIVLGTDQTLPTANCMAMAMPTTVSQPTWPAASAPVAPILRLDRPRTQAVHLTLTAMIRTTARTIPVTLLLVLAPTRQSQDAAAPTQIVALVHPFAISGPTNASNVLPIQSESIRPNPLSGCVPPFVYW